MNYFKKKLFFLLIDIIDIYLKMKLSFVLKEKIIIIGFDFFGFNWFLYVIYKIYSLFEYNNIMILLKMKLMIYIIRIVLKIGIMLYVILFV